jgi:phosphatidylglycerophosphate synthase
VAACCCATGTRAGYVAGALLLQLSFGLDCADGQLARLTATFSDLGGWLDAMCDRLKEFLVYGGLALGSARSGEDVWLLAAGALVLQAVRQAVDSSWSVTPASVSAMAEGAQRRAAGGRRRWHWARKVAILPIGERWLLISVLTAVTRPRVVFAVLLGAGALAGLYMVAARVRRSLRPSGDGAPDAAPRLDRLRDAGPLAALVARAGPLRPGAALALPLAGAAVLAAAQVAALRAGSAGLVAAGALAFAVLAALGGRRPPDPGWGWTVPPLLRGAEYTTVVTTAWVSGAGVGAVTYVYLLAVVWHHHDSAYRVRHGLWDAAPLSAGFDARTPAVAALATAGAGAYALGTGVLAAVLVVLAAARARRLWRPSAVAAVRSAGRGGTP